MGPMAKVLVIGGTQFIGRHVVQKLLNARHSVTLFNRAKTAPDLFPELKKIRADRQSSEIHKLAELRQDWDAVIDLCAYYPKDVESLTSLLKGRAGRYILCSTMSVYQASDADGPTPIIDEDSPLHTCSQAESSDTAMKTYGPRKAECERVAFHQQSDGIPVVALRPCVVYGAFDHTDRFAYWIWRASRDKPFLLPDDGLTIVRRTYAPDLAQAFESAVSSEIALGKSYNIAETDPLSFRDSLIGMGQHLGRTPMDYAISVSAEKLLKLGVKAWTDLPMWIPKKNLLVDTFRSRRDLGFMSTPAEKAVADAADAFLLEGRVPRAGLSALAEQELISKINVAVS